MWTRTTIPIPTSGMAIAFIMGLGLAAIWGMQVAVTGAETFAQFFTALAVVFPMSSALTWIILLILLFSIFYLSRILLPFFLGIIVGLLILTFLGSSIFGGITASSVNVTGYKGLGNGIFNKVHGPQAQLFKGLKT